MAKKTEQTAAPNATQKAEETAQLRIGDKSWDFPIVVGSEGRGISEAVRPFVTYYITIPKFGSAESLNAAVAAAIVGDNLRRAVGEP